MISNQPNKPLTFLMMIFAYTVILHVALPVIAVYLKTQSDPQYLDALHIDVANMISTEQVPLILYAAAAVLLVTAIKVPLVMLRRAKGSMPPGAVLPVEKILVPYLIRISLLESVSVVGLVMAILTQEPMTILPFVAVGLGGTLLMPPNPGFLSRFAAQAD